MASKVTSAGCSARPALFGNLQLPLVTAAAAFPRNQPHRLAIRLGTVILGRDCPGHPEHARRCPSYHRRVASEGSHALGQLFQRLGSLLNSCLADNAVWVHSSIRRRSTAVCRTPTLDAETCKNRSSIFSLFRNQPPQPLIWPPWSRQPSAAGPPYSTRICNNVSEFNSRYCVASGQCWPRAASRRPSHNIPDPLLDVNLLTKGRRQHC